MPTTDQQLFEAFRYIAGEMPAQEEHQFELRLASCESLQQAVVDATQLSVVVAVSPRPAASARQQKPTAATPQKSSRVLASTAAVIACTLMLALSFRTSATVEADPSAIVSAWAEQSSDITEDLSDIEDVSSELDVPDWMLTALAATESELQENL